jgi:hypothetical protein
VVQYARDGTEVWIVPGQPDHKIWWRNLSEPTDVEVRLAGVELRGTALALDGAESPDELRRGLVLYFRQLPSAAKALGVPASSGEVRETDLADLTRRAVIVRIDLDTTP